MKAKVTRGELKECVKNALVRVMSERKDFDYNSKHEKAKKGQFTKKEKGNKGNRNWQNFDEDDE